MKKTAEQIAREATQPKTAAQVIRASGRKRSALRRHQARRLALNGVRVR